MSEELIEEIKKVLSTRKAIFNECLISLGESFERGDIDMETLKNKQLLCADMFIEKYNSSIDLSFDESPCLREIRIRDIEFFEAYKRLVTETWNTLGLTLILSKKTK